jgi:hypothetical protein
MEGRARHCARARVHTGRRGRGGRLRPVARGRRAAVQGRRAAGARRLAALLKRPPPQSIIVHTACASAEPHDASTMHVIWVHTSESPYSPS